MTPDSNTGSGVLTSCAVAGGVVTGAGATPTSLALSTDKLSCSGTVTPDSSGNLLVTATDTAAGVGYLGGSSAGCFVAPGAPLRALIIPAFRRPSAYVSRARA